MSTAHNQTVYVCLDYLPPLHGTLMNEWSRRDLTGKGRGVRRATSRAANKQNGALSGMQIQWRFIMTIDYL